VDVHQGKGFGVYSNFTCFDIVAPEGIVIPDKDQVAMENPFTRSLGCKGEIEHVLRVGDKKFGKAVKIKNDQVRLFGLHECQLLIIDGTD